jgi:hypothetical protein
MRLSLLAAAAILALATPAFADAASELASAKAEIAAAKLSTATNLHMWCGAAFTVVSAKLNSTGDAANAKLASDASDALFTTAAPLLTADGVASADMGKISADYTAVAYAQTIDNTEAAEFTQAECEAAAKAK